MDSSWLDDNGDVKQFKDHRPRVGDVWTADETMVDLDGQHKVWIYNVIDEKTRYLLASRIAISRTTRDAELVMKEAQKRAGKMPKQVLTDANRSYDDGLEQAFGADTEHVKTKPFTSGANTQRVERYHGTYKDRVKVMRAFKDVETLIQFNDGWLVYYNYFKPHQSLDNRTPAEEAGIDYSVKNWADLLHEPIPKQSYIEEVEPIFPKAKVSLEKAFKRRRAPRISRRMPRITPPMLSLSQIRLRK